MMAALLLLRLCLSIVSVVAAARPLTLELHPTAQLLHEGEEAAEIHPNSNAVYAALNPSKRSLRHEEFHEEFERLRHLSRHEIQYRLQNDLDLEIGWDGFYREVQQDDKEDDDDEQMTEEEEKAALAIYAGPGPVIPQQNNNNNNNNSSTQQTATTQTKQHEFFSGQNSMEENVVEETPSADGEGESMNGGLLNNYQTAPLSQGYGTHYATVWVGSPTPQRKSVIVDTGSHYTAFPCKGCRNCGEEHHTDSYFDPSKSQSFVALSCSDCKMGARCQEDQCSFSQSYTEGSSWHAFQVTDKFFCGGTDVLAAANPIDHEFAIDFMFGCQISETGLFVTQLADGIMGMSAHEATLTKQMYEKGKLEHNLFTLCFRREVNVSKRGVTAGSMTLGGIDTRLDSSPMVFAKNVARSGWYTVHVKNIFIRTNGGESAKTSTGAADDSEHHIMKIPLDVNALNSGKGVIVDSGTTDTYLHRDLAKSFGEVWKHVTGKEYSNTAISLSKEKLLRLPTVLVQLGAFDNELDPSVGSADEVPGLVGESLDPRAPGDVLLAIPATHYMEYSPGNDQYTSRLYFTESRGGVLGANAMQGHNVLFDWENGRVGFAESTCDYGVETQLPNAGGDTDEGGMGNDCVLGVPSLSESCMRNVDLSLCVGDESLTLRGTEKWTMVVSNAGTQSGMSCTDAALLKSGYSGKDPPTVGCDGNGLCFEIRPCEVTCANAQSAGEIIPMKHHDDPSGGDNPDPDKNDGEKSPTCADNLWGACEYSCTQSRVQSILMSDGICHEELRDHRPCHIDACGRSDPCRVPFVVHAIVVFRGADADLWQRISGEVFALALAKTVNANIPNSDDQLFGVGDVKVLMTSPWFSSDDAQVNGKEVPEDDGNEKLGLKVVAEISIFNPNAKLPQSQLKEDVLSDDASVNATTAQKNHLQTMVNKVKKAIHHLQGPPLATCEESDLYPLARTALDVHKELSKPHFVELLLEEIEKWDALVTGSPGAPSSPFRPVYQDPGLAQQSRVVTSWTIRTEINDADGNSVVQSSPVSMMAIVASLLMFTCACGMCCGSRCARRREYGAVGSSGTFKPSLIEQMRERTDRGRYSQVGASPGHVDDDDDSMDEYVSTSSRYRDDPLQPPSGDVELAERRSVES